MSTDMYDEHLRKHGDLVHNHPNGDRVVLHMSRFHGVCVTATRTYKGDVVPTEVSAYLGDPQAVLEWLTEASS